MNKYQIAYEVFKQDIELGLYDNSLISAVMQFGRLLAFLELSDFTESERENEKNKLAELSFCWAKRYYSKEDK